MANSITPPPELVQQLRLSSGTWLDQITNAYQAGADQELEACCKWLDERAVLNGATALRATRRPKPPSLKEQALKTLKYPKDLWSQAEVETIRRALEALDD
jgi:hypothetical protein